MVYVFELSLPTYSLKLRFVISSRINRTDKLYSFLVYCHLRCSLDGNLVKYVCLVLVAASSGLDLCATLCHKRLIGRQIQRRISFGFQMLFRCLLLVSRLVPQCFRQDEILLVHVAVVDLQREVDGCRLVVRGV